jgi:uncharacterized protein (DUF2336 family)
MSVEGSNFALLIDLAKETSSEKRRELLRQITDTFLAPTGDRSESEAELFDEIVGVVAADLETQVRIELARKVAASRHSIRRTARRLALDTIEVAAPVIEGSRALTQGDLVEIIEQRSQAHMMAVTQRRDIGEKVSSALVARGEDPVVASLLRNETAKISRETFERVADRAASNPALHAPFVGRKTVPLDLLNAIYHKVTTRLRREIMQNFQNATAAEIEAAIEAGCEKLSGAYGALPKDYLLAKEYVDELEKRGALHSSILDSILRDNKKTSFLIAFSRLVGVDYELMSRLVENADIDGLALLCRSANFNRDLFVALCLMIVGGSGGLAKAQMYVELYEKVPVAAAQRAVRFWKVRANAASSATDTDTAAA